MQTACTHETMWGTGPCGRRLESYRRPPVSFGRGVDRTLGGDNGKPVPRPSQNLTPRPPSDDFKLDKNTT